MDSTLNYRVGTNADRASPFEVDFDPDPDPDFDPDFDFDLILTSFAARVR
jgi:hypothetical protein